MRALALALFLLAGCSERYVATCPNMPEYSDAFTKEFLAEYKQITPGSAIDTFIIDAKSLRNQVRECWSKQQ